MLNVSKRRHVIAILKIPNSPILWEAWNLWSVFSFSHRLLNTATFVNILVDPDVKTIHIPAVGLLEVMCRRNSQFLQRYSFTETSPCEKINFKGTIRIFEKKPVVSSCSLKWQDKGQDKTSCDPKQYRSGSLEDIWLWLWRMVGFHNTMTVFQSGPLNA